MRKAGLDETNRWIVSQTPCLKNTRAFGGDDRAEAVSEERHGAVEQRLQIVEVCCRHSLDAAERRFPQSVRPPRRMHGDHINRRRQMSWPQAIGGRAGSGEGKADKPQRRIEPWSWAIKAGIRSWLVACSAFAEA